MNFVAFVDSVFRIPYSVFRIPYSVFRIPYSVIRHMYFFPFGIFFCLAVFLRIGKTGRHSYTKQI